MGRSIQALLVALALSFLLAGRVSAHANLARSTPAAGALLETAPTELVLEYTEELDPSFTRVQLFDSRNQLVNPGPGTIDPAAPKVLRLPLGQLPKDSYTAIYRVRSAVDGHVTEGSVPFGVGVAATATSLIPPPGTPDPATQPPPPLDAAARWLNLLAAAVALGGLPFALLVWRPAFRRATTDDRRPLRHGSGQATTDEHNVAVAWSVVGGRWSEADDAMTSFIRRLTLIGGALFLLTNALFLLTQAAAAAGVPLAQALGAPALGLLGSRTGQLILARGALTLLLMALAWRLPPAGRGAAWPWWVALALAGGVALTFSLNSHGAAEPRGAALATTLDWLHLAAMIAWLGGLLPLLFAIRAARRTPEQALPLSILIPRFSWVSAPSIALLTLTGLYSYLLHVERLDLLAATTYGRALLLKLGLFAVLLLLGGLNLFVLSRRLHAGTTDDGRRTMRRRLSSIVYRQTADSSPGTLHLKPGLARAFGRSVRAEVVAGALLLLMVGAMTSVAPSKSAWEAHDQLGMSQEASAGDVDLVLRVAPARIGDNEWAVDVTDRRPGAQAAPAKVLLRFDMLGMDMGLLQTEAQPAGAERYTARGSFTSMGGRWSVEVVLRRAGFDDVRHTFELDLVRSAALAP